MVKSKLFKRNSGFSLIEILAVLGIIGGLIAFIVPRLVKQMGQASIRSTKLTMQDIKGQLNLYRQDMGGFPKSREGGLDLLINPPKPRGNWNGPYIDSRPKDKWGNEIEYNAPANDKENGAFELISYGPSGVPGEDNIIIGEKEI